MIVKTECAYSIADLNVRRTSTSIQTPRYFIYIKLRNFPELALVLFHIGKTLLSAVTEQHHLSNVSTALFISNGRTLVDLGSWRNLHFPLDSKLTELCANWSSDLLSMAKTQ